MLQTGDNETVEGKINQYLILREIGTGAFGKVSLCKSEHDKRYYACKVVNKSKLKKKFRFKGGPTIGPHAVPAIAQNSENDPMNAIRKEIAILKKLSKHPKINALVEVLNDEAEDNLYMCEIIHRDLKPDNLLLTVNRVLQISDFGISHVFNEGEDDRITDKNTTPLFCPPEACQMDGTNVAEIKGFPLDVWSMGATLFCFVHGCCPFEDECLVDLYSKICNNEPAISNTLSTELQTLIHDMLDKNPSTRPTLKKIRANPWVLNYGREPLISEEENCVMENVTEEEIMNAVSPGRKLMDQVKKIFKKVTTKIALKSGLETPSVRTDFSDCVDSISSSQEIPFQSDETLAIPMPQKILGRSDSVLHSGKTSQDIRKVKLTKQLSDFINPKFVTTVSTAKTKSEFLAVPK
ncbi:Calcium/calmodulin-dependent protein kinase kinase 1 [Physocladia obscura]|uniref:Calcium/calmodulin-dependent protein kinase kinase 1 n=1 Tax=Physocladia obscura TaxID=109957 RepID=A0AAD5XIP3_9FUNG|nr:Calcium/calmodulin-dependent protein kinase kinase 1 [Physocladia obscura]